MGEGAYVTLLPTGPVAQWLNPEEKVHIRFMSAPRRVRRELIALHEDFVLEGLWGNE